MEYDEAVEIIMGRAEKRASTIVSALAVHGVMTGVLDRVHRARLNAFDLVTADGQPVRWAVNLLGHRRLSERVYGPELTLRLCSAAEQREVGVFLFGSTPDVVHAMERSLLARFPKLRVVGTQPHRFRPATLEEDAGDVEAINRSGAGIVFVGLGCPRQEIWAFEHRGRVDGVMVCVGAAFDFHAGNKSQAPFWMQRMGLEWLFRLMSEPRRLWRRYLLLNPAYVVLFLAQWTRLWRPNAGSMDGVSNHLKSADS